MTKIYFPHILLIILLLLQTILPTLSKFEPYNLNGGLISAIAGKNYILLASDTRLSNGYDILSRQHLQSRMYKVSSTVYIGEEHLLDDCASVKIPSTLSEVLLYRNNDEKKDSNIIRMNVCDGALIGSSGCASDCEALKRHLITEVVSKSFFSTSNNLLHQKLHAGAISNLLSQVLYSRRSFPFYAFCVTAGFDNDDIDSGGVVHVYDAIGSHERVAVGTCGSGKEMLQPILDRLFSVSEFNEYATTTSQKIVQRDENAILASKQLKGLLDLTPPVKTYVDCCDVEEAIGLLICGYRSVAEREISVGDDVVVCIMRKDEEGDLNGSLEIRRFPLKKH